MGTKGTSLFGCLFCPPQKLTLQSEAGHLPQGRETHHAFSQTIPKGGLEFSWVAFWGWLKVKRINPPCWVSPLKRHTHTHTRKSGFPKDVLGDEQMPDYLGVGAS